MAWNVTLKRVIMVSWKTIEKSGFPFFVHAGIGDAGEVGRREYIPEGGTAMLNKPCPRCRTMIPYGRAYCEACLPVVLEDRAKAKEHRDAKRQQKYNKAYNARRDPKYGRFYNSKEWKTLSRAKLSACGYKCEARLPGCQHIACEVHHTAPIKTPEGWEKRLEWDGLQGVCIACHNILDGKTFKRKEDPGVLDIRKIER